jgi:hypothetical protein
MRYTEKYFFDVRGSHKRDVLNGSSPYWVLVQDDDFSIQKSESQEFHIGLDRPLDVLSSDHVWSNEFGSVCACTYTDQHMFVCSSDNPVRLQVE